MQLVALYILALLACVVVLHIAQRYVRSTRPLSSYPLPPGPRGLLFVGSVTGVDSEAPRWSTYAEWAKKYGDLIYTRVIGNDIIILNSEAVAKDLLETRSRNYSDRPFVATKELCGRDFSSVLMEYGQRWRLHRRFFHQAFRSDAVHRFMPLQHRKAFQLLQRLLDSPDQFRNHIFEYTASVILNSVYDYDPKSPQEELFDTATKMQKITGRAFRPDVSILIGACPALLKLPSWLPGMSFKREMETVKAFSKKYIEKPFEYSLQRRSAGSSAPSMVFDALQNMENVCAPTNAGLTKDLSEAAATAFLAASDTSNSVISIFLLMMVVNPEVQKKAQNQIDAVVGVNRLPTSGDRPMLPYIDAIFRETLRYHPVVPLSIPHAVVEDDVYVGYHIPKGAIVLSNLWSMCHDESKYPNSHAFIPERFLNEDGMLTSDTLEHATFGFGRRICVGRHFADASVWTVIAKVLALFNIDKAKDENGVEIPVQVKFTNTLVSHPLPFQCSITPRVSGMDTDRLQQLMEASTT